MGLMKLGWAGEIRTPVLPRKPFAPWMRKLGGGFGLSSFGFLWVGMIGNGG